MPEDQEQEDSQENSLLLQKGAKSLQRNEADFLLQKPSYIVDHNPTYPIKNREYSKRGPFRLILIVK